MAYATGSDAVIKIGSDTLTQCSAFSIDKTVDNAETSAIGTTSKTFVNTLDSWTGEANGVFTASVTITGTGTLTEATAS